MKKRKKIAFFLPFLPGFNGAASKDTETPRPYQPEYPRCSCFNGAASKDTETPALQYRKISSPQYRFNGAASKDTETPTLRHFSLQT